MGLEVLNYRRQRANCNICLGGFLFAKPVFILVFIWQFEILRSMLLVSCPVCNFIIYYNIDHLIKFKSFASRVTRIRKWFRLSKNGFNSFKFWKHDVFFYDFSQSFNRCFSAPQSVTKNSRNKLVDFTNFAVQAIYHNNNRA